ncbi:hypothetical protein GDO78_018946 [Eleutherodactylus coqui]|uniref:Uncharacterized protein n=1 Tax=Eleutherodactylus coqui TaxID=57060 RepID=A0A8J6EJG5_ELECQ|nr:hypothetical protein GDO78_018946 [Eleutherodactylus coqui]
MQRLAAQQPESKTGQRVGGEAMLSARHEAQKRTKSAKLQEHRANGRNPQVCFRFPLMFAPAYLGARCNGPGFPHHQVGRDI